MFIAQTMMYFSEAFHVEPAGRAHGHADRRTEAVEERIAAREPVQCALVAQIAMIHDGLGAVLIDDLRPALLDLCERLVIGDALELAATFGSHAFQRVHEAVGIVVMFGVVLELHAQSATGHRMLWIACDFYQFAIFDVVEERASIRTILRTDASDNTRFADVDGH
jgi:hypothetical protein